MRTKDDAHEGDRPRRFVAITVSLGIAFLSTSFVIDAFSGERDPERSGAVASDGPVDNGSIYFRAGNDQGQTMDGIVEPDGSGQRDAFPGDPAAQHEQLSFSPDGRRLAYVDGREDHRGIYVANADGSNAIRVTDQLNDSWPNWSPDGTKIAFVGTRFDPTIGFCQPGGGLLGCPTDIYTMGADGSNVTDITDDQGFEFDPTWSPDGTKIAFASTSDVAASTTITLMNADGTGRVKMSPSNGGSDFHPSWSPDGTQIVFGGIHYEDWGLFKVRADGTDERTLLFGVGTYAVDPAWSPDGSLIAFGGNVGDYGHPEGVFAMRSGGSGITKLAEVPQGWGISEIAWRPAPPPPPETASGVLAFARSLPMTGGAIVPKSEIWLMNEDGSDATQITDAQRDGEVAAEPSWSPDGARIAFVLSTPDHLGAYAGDGDIAVMNADGSNVTRLTAGLRDAYPVWSPDGSRIAFERDQQSELEIMNTDGSSVHRLLSAAPALWDTQSPSWSPDGSRILYTEVHHDETTSLSTINVSDGTISPITRGPGDYTAAWSPDGQAIVFAHGADLYRMNLDGTGPQRLTRCHMPDCVIDFGPSWSADGRLIAFVQQQGGGTTCRSTSCRRMVAVSPTK